jgi:hypothetical protein
MDQRYHEYYVTYWYHGASGARYGYLHTINGGNTWYNGTISVNGDDVVGQAVAAQPTVAGDGPLYIAYVADPGSDESPAHGTRIGFLIGTDHLGTLGVDFDYLYASEDVPLTFDLNHLAGTSHVATLLPGGPGMLEVRTVPWLLADPTNANRLFLVYHTTKANSWTEADGHADFDIYARVLTKSGGYWSAGTEVKVNNDNDLEFEADQFTPSPVVDEDGRLHITWYDDRLYNVSSDQADGAATPNPKFDVYYARGVVNGQGQLTFPTGNELLYGTGDEAEEAGLNYVRLHAPNPDWDFPDRPGEYNGIAVDGNTVWTTFTGTSAQDDNQVNNPSVIWSSLIVWTP